MYKEKNTYRVVLIQKERESKSLRIKGDVKRKKTVLKRESSVRENMVMWMKEA